MAGQKIFLGFEKDNARDLGLFADASIDVLGMPLVTHLLPHLANGKSERPFPGPAHIHVAGLILDVLANDVAAQTISRSVASPVGLDPHNRRTVQGFPLRREPFLRDPEAARSLRTLFTWMVG